MPDPSTDLSAPATPIVTPAYLDKALWLGVLGPVLAIASNKLGINLNAGELVGVMLPIVSYIVMHKWKTGMLQAAQIQGQSAVAALNSTKAAADAIRSVGQ